MKSFFKNINNLLVCGTTVLFIAFNSMFYNYFDKNDKISVYALLTLSMIFYFVVLIMYAIFKNNKYIENKEDFKIIDIFSNDSGTHLILKENSSMFLNTIYSIYLVEKKGYEEFAGLGYVYNIAKDKKVDVKIITCSIEKIKEKKSRKMIVIKKDLNFENLQNLLTNERE